MIIFAWLAVFHLLADYPLQGDFMAKAKNHTAPITGIPWLTVLFSHAAIHAGFVGLITGSWICAVIELFAHALIDYSKCNGEISFNIDQALHILCKVGYAVAIATLATP